METLALAAEIFPSSYLLSGIPGAMYYAYYYKNYCGQVPEVFAGEGPFLELLKEHCVILKEEYRPPPLLHESRLMTIMAAVGRHRGLSYPFMREKFLTVDGGEIALDWWDRRLKPESPAEVPVVSTSPLVDALSYYYHNLSLPHIRLPQILIPQMRIPRIQIPYFGPMKRSASATGNEFEHLDSVSAEVRRDEESTLAQECLSSPDNSDFFHDAVSDEGGEYGVCSSPEGELAEIDFTGSDVPDIEEAASPDDPPGVLLENAKYDLEMRRFSDQTDGVDFKSEPVPAEAFQHSDIPQPKGIVLIIPGIMGDSTRNYVQGLVQVVEQLEYTAVVMNYRGATGNLKACFMADTTDVRQVLTHLKLRYPHVPIIAVGVSLGGILITNYLARCGMNNEDSLLLGVMTVSVAWNSFESAKELEQPLNWLLFNRMLTRCLCEAVQKHAEILQTVYDLEGVQDARTLRELDDKLMAKMFGYSSADEYYKGVTLHDKVCHIKTPLLAINAADDVFSPYDAIPKEEANRNPNVCILVTSHGGHVGFLEGKNPFGTNYVERVFHQYAKMLFENADKTIASPVQLISNDQVAVIPSTLDEPVLISE